MIKRIVLPMAAIAIGVSPIQAEETESAVLSSPTVTAVVSPSAESMPQVWSYADCVEWASTHSLDIRRNMLDMLLADEDIASAKDAWLPTVDFSTSHSFSNYPSPQDGQKANAYSSSYGVNGSWTIWEGNIRKYKLASSKLLRQQKEYAGANLMVDIELGILQAYLNIMYNQEAIEIAKRSLEVSTAQTARAKRLMETGKSSKVDYAQIESQEAQDKYSLVQAEANYASAVMSLKKLLELNLTYDLQIASVTFSDDEISIPLQSKEEVYLYASQWLPSFKSNAINKDIYAYNEKIAKAGRLPRISLQGGVGTGYNTGGRGGWGSQMGHGFNENIGVGVSIPIYDANSTKRSVAEAKLNALNYELEQETLLNNLSQTIENLYIESTSARAKYETGLVQLESAELTSELVNRQFELGDVNAVELLTAHNNLLNARLELLQSKYMAILSNKTIQYYATQSVNISE
jgi:outer membrane protein